jgi:hypothetical protein
MLWSLRRRGKLHLEVLPAAGKPWSLTAVGRLDSEGRGAEAFGDVGLFTQGKQRPHLIVMRSGDELVYSGSQEPRVDGRVYPAAEVARVAAALPFVVGAHVVMDRAGSLGQPLRVLVAFTGSRVASAAERRTLEIAIQRAIGAEHLPDRVVLVPLSPRRQGVAVDAKWCESQYAAGLLFHKPRQRVYQLLTQLRERTS